jgi:hypothetical protein
MHAENLYCSELFYKSRRYAQAHFDGWLILSAKHGLIRPEDVIAPYDCKLTTLSKPEKQELAKRLSRQAAKLFSHPVQIESICGEEYDSLLEEAHVRFESNREFALPIGKKLKALGQVTDPEENQKLLDQVYGVIGRLSKKVGLKCLRDLLESDMPESGVYLFFDQSERRLKDLSQLRIIRVGTHGVAAGSKASLRNRMRTHFGTTSGEGNHRSSVFRLHVGRSMINAKYSADIASWGSTTADKNVLVSERSLEQAVSAYLGNLSALLISVPGQSDKNNDRAYVEQNLIALLSNALKPLDPPSHSWLGLHSAKPVIRKSGIWNVNHVEQPVDRRFLEILDFYVSLTVGAKAPPKKQLAPAEWQARARDNVRQLALL